MCIAVANLGLRYLEACIRVFGPSGFEISDVEIENSDLTGQIRVKICSA
jgi:hypothetical protein